jgi:hypothetical protein
MKALLQRVSHASVTVDGAIVGQIGRGFCVLLGVTHSDTQAEAEWLANKIAGLRLFEDEAGKMNLGLSRRGRRGAGGQPVYALWGCAEGKTAVFHRRRSPRNRRTTG